MPILRLCFVLFSIFLFTSFQRTGRKPLENEGRSGKRISTDTIFLTASPEANENLTAFLARYDLADFGCNRDKFLKINGLKKNKPSLKPGHEYKLPIVVFRYNGKSIRTSIQTDDLEKALRIERYNKESLKQKRRRDHFVESKNLWVPWHELADCADAGEQPEEAKTNNADSEDLDEGDIPKERAYLGNRTFPIFGNKYEKTALIDRKLKGKVFYVVGGHGGPDTGAQGKRAGKTLCEDEYAYDVALRLVRNLVSHGATAYMIVRDENDGIRDEEFLRCDSDEKVWGNQTVPKAQKERLFQRSDLLNKMTWKHKKEGHTNQTLLEIHVDSRSRNARTDVFFYYRKDSEKSEKLARHIHKTFSQKYLRVRAQRRYSGTVTSRDLHMLRETTVPSAVYIELANIRNEHDQERIIRPKNRQALANWLSEALISAK